MAAANSDFRWKPMTVKEAYIFLGILIYTGSYQNLKIRDYFRSPQGSCTIPSGVKSYISYYRFLLLHRLFTVSPYSTKELQDSLVSKNKVQPRRKASGSPPKEPHWIKVEPL